MGKKTVSLEEFRKMDNDEQRENFKFLSDVDRARWRLSCPIYGKTTGEFRMTEKKKKEVREAMEAIFNAEAEGRPGLEGLNEFTRRKREERR